MRLHKGAMIAMLLSSVAFANTGNESGLYIGGGVGFLSSESHATILEPFTFTKDPDNTEKINSLGFNLGYRLSANHRLYYEYRAFNRKIFHKKNDVSLSNVGYAFTPKIGNHWRALLSGFIGSMVLKDDFRNDARALASDIMLGTIFELQEQHEIVSGFRYERAKFDVTYAPPPGVFGNPPGTLQLTNSGFFVGYNYKF